MKRIIQQDDDVGKMAAAVPVMVAKMSEIFITRLLEQSGKVMEDRGSRTLSVDHVAGAIREDVRYQHVLTVVTRVLNNVFQARLLDATCQEYERNREKEQVSDREEK